MVLRASLKRSKFPAHDAILSHSVLVQSIMGPPGAIEQASSKSPQPLMPSLLAPLIEAGSQQSNGAQQ
jgi:hypothetical protein